MCKNQISKKVEGGFIIVPCGTCHECLEKRRAEWSFRLLQELDCAQSAFFVTLTYSEENLPEDSNLNPEHWSRFIKNLKARNEYYGKRNKLEPRKLRYFACGEYGEKDGRPHYHIILFNLYEKLITNLQRYVDIMTGEVKNLVDLEGCWQYGNIFVGEVTQASIHYTTGYLINQDNRFKERVEPFARMSRKPYLGACYLEKKGQLNYHKKQEFPEVQVFDKKLSMPRVYRNRIYSKVKSLEFAEKIQEKIKDEFQKEVLKCGFKKTVLREFDQSNGKYQKFIKTRKGKLL